MNSFNFEKKHFLIAFSAMGFFGVLNSLRVHLNRLNKRNKAISSKENSIDVKTEIKEEIEVKKEVSLETIENLCEKIKNSLIHTICICIDKMNLSKVKVKEVKNIEKKETQNDDDIVVETNEVDTNQNIVNVAKPTEIDPLIDELERKDKFLTNFEKSLYDFSQKQDTISSKIFIQIRL